MDKLNELRNQKSTLLATANTHLEVNQIEQANEILLQVEELNKTISIHERMRDETERTLTPEIEPKADDKSSTDIRTSNEYHKAFFNALKNGETLKSAKGKEEYGILFDAMTVGVPADGGFLVPEDVDNTINELRRDFTDLSQFVTLETVNTMTGSRVKEKAANLAKYVEVAELGTLPNIDNPQFETVEYTVKKYAGILPVSNELLDDNAANLSSYITRWFARMGVNTDNANIINILNTLVGTSYDIAKGINPLKTALNELLDPAISVRSIILTNQSGFNALDQINDGTGRGLLQPDPANATIFRALGRRVVPVSNAILSNSETDIPVYVGDFMDLITLFRRKGIEIASTNIGAGTFETDSTKIRGIMRADYQKFDAKAAVKLNIPLTTISGGG